MNLSERIQINRAGINRANSQHSTGPKTEEGKQKCSLNALRHGFTSQVIVMPTEDLEVYQRHLESYTSEYNPKGATEAHLVQALADASWRLNRAAAIETNLLTIPTVTASGAITAAVSVAQALGEHSKALATLSMHSQRLSRQFEKTLALLRQLQATRRAEEARALADLLDIMETHKEKGEAYLPSQDGFVFSEPEIDAAIRMRNRQRSLEKVRARAAQS